MLYTQWTKANKAFNVDYALTATYTANKSNTANSGYELCSYCIVCQLAEIIFWTNWFDPMNNQFVCDYFLKYGCVKQQVW